MSDYRAILAELEEQLGKEQAALDAQARDLLARGHARTPEEARERAHYSAETFAAVKAVADARGVGAHTARQRHKEEVRQVRETARERAERKGTTVAEELPRAAEWSVKAERTAKQERDERRQRHGLRFIEVEGKLQDAKRKVVEAIGASLGVDFGPEERDLLLHTVGEVQEATQLARSAIAGRPGADFQRKLQVLKGGLAS